MQSAVYLFACLLLCAVCLSSQVALEQKHSFPGPDLQSGAQVTVTQGDKASVFTVEKRIECNQVGICVEFFTDSGSKFTIKRVSSDPDLQCVLTQIAGAEPGKLSGSEQARAFSYMGLNIGCKTFLLADLADLHCQRDGRFVRSITSSMNILHEGTAKFWKIFTEKKASIYTGDSFTFYDFNNVLHRYQLGLGGERAFKEAKSLAFNLRFSDVKDLIQKYLRTKNWRESKINTVMGSLSGCRGSINVGGAMNIFKKMEGSVLSDPEYCDVYEAFTALFSSKHEKPNLQTKPEWAEMFQVVEQIQCCIVEIKKRR